MIDFFGRQDVARARSGRFVALFALAVVAIVCGLYAVVVGVEYWTLTFEYRDSAGNAGRFLDDVDAASVLWQPMLLLGTALCSAIVIAIGARAERKRLDAGGGSVALALGGRQVLRGRADDREAMLLNIVEEMAIASGYPMPHVFVMQDEMGINAFAAGWTPEDAAVTVTRGALMTLNRDELQGVIAHEMSHLLEGDTRLNMRLMAWLAGIQAIGTAGAVMVRVGAFGRHSKNTRQSGAWPLIVAGAAVWLVGSVGLFAGRILRAAVAREREHLADASAVQFTRDARGLANALKKIGGWSAGSGVRAPQAAGMSHLFLGAPHTSFWGKHLFASHPPLLARIRLLDPTFDGQWPTVAQIDSIAPQARQAGQMGLAAPGAAVAATGLVERPTGGVVTGPAVSSAAANHNAAVNDNAAATNPASPLAQARQLIDAIPDELRHAAQQPWGATATMLSLLVSPDEAIRTRQVEALRGIVGGEGPGSGGDRLVSDVLRLAHVTTRLTPSMRLPLCELAAPALGDLSPAQGKALARAVRELADADGARSIFELALERVVVRRLVGRSLPRVRPPQSVGQRSISEAMSAVVSALCHVGGGGDATKVATAFAAARATLPPLWRKELTLQSSDALTFAQLDAALDRLAGAAPHLHQRAVQACSAAVYADDIVTIEEAELLRGVAEAVGVALPPIWATA